MSPDSTLLVHYTAQVLPILQSSSLCPPTVSPVAGQAVSSSWPAVLMSTQELALRLTLLLSGTQQTT